MNYKTKGNRYDDKIKEQAVNYMNEGHMLHEAANKFNTSQATIWRWVQKHNQEINGAEADKRKDPKPFGGRVYYCMDPYRVLEFLKEHPDASSQDVIDSGIVKNVTRTTVQTVIRHIKTNGLLNKTTEEDEEYIEVPANTLDKILSEVSSFREVLHTLKQQSESMKRENENLKSELRSCKSDNEFLRRRMAEMQKCL